MQKTNQLADEEKLIKILFDIPRRFWQIRKCPKEFAGNSKPKGVMCPKEFAGNSKPKGVIFDSRNPESGSLQYRSNAVNRSVVGTSVEKRH